MVIRHIRSKGIGLAQKLYKDIYKAKAPGSLMLMGEHAVLQAKPALVMAINRYLHLSLKPRKDRLISIFSALGTLETSLDALEIAAPFQFLLSAVQSYQSILPSGFELTIESDFSEKIGFGSSAAVIVATLKILHDFIGREYEPNHIFQQAKEIVLKVQGQGSGADVAASVYGGIIYYQVKDSANQLNDLVKIEKLTQVNVDFPTLYAVYSGHKVPTPIVITQVKQAQKNHEALYKQIFDAMALCTEQAREVLIEKNWKHFGQLMNIHHGLQSALGLSNPILESLVYNLRNIPGMVGAKISGAGLGDCVIGLGSESLQETLSSDHIPLQLALED